MKVTLKEEMELHSGRKIPEGTELEVTREKAKELGLLRKKNAKKKAPKNESLTNESENKEQLDKPD
jgi:hypothetical protein